MRPTSDRSEHVCEFGACTKRVRGNFPFCAEHSAATPSPDGCPTCGGSLVCLGELGALVYFRCRDCGSEHSA